MKAAVHDIEFTAGDDYSLQITFKDNAAPPVAINVSGITFTAQVRPFANSADSTSFTVVATSAASGIITIKLSHTQTALLAQGSVWDIQGSASGLITTYIIGKVSADPQTTR